MSTCRQAWRRPERFGAMQAESRRFLLSSPIMPIFLAVLLDCPAAIGAAPVPASYSLICAVKGGVNDGLSFDLQYDADQNLVTSTDLKLRISNGDFKYPNDDNPQYSLAESVKIRPDPPGRYLEFGYRPRFANGMDGPATRYVLDRVAGTLTRQYESDLVTATCAATKDAW